MAVLDEPTRTLKWKELSGQERYRVVMLARKGEVTVQELCTSFGVSRQTLYRAMEATDQAAMEALEPKKRGRKPAPVSDVQTKELTASNATLKKELDHWKTKYEVAKTFIELERQLEQKSSRSGRGEKKRRGRRKKTD
ncbi:MAG TPA: helix-turn-helix domain-containing protein [Patescibacteria group bacterium]|nr:helix-turn-helix domain-containing protein [Patescibacteria group bacterium]